MYKSPADIVLFVNTSWLPFQLKYQLLCGSVNVYSGVPRPAVS